MASSANLLMDLRSSGRTMALMESIRPKSVQLTSDPSIANMGRDAIFYTLKKEIMKRKMEKGFTTFWWIIQKWLDNWKPGKNQES